MARVLKINRWHFDEFDVGVFCFLIVRARSGLAVSVCVV